jgi:hypothetical protein
MIKLKICLSLLIIFGAIIFTYSILSTHSKSIPQPNIDDPKDTPRIENGYIITRVKVIPVSEITYIEIVSGIKATVRYVIIHYEKDKYSGGMLSISIPDYMKIRSQLHTLEISSYEI